MNSTFAIRKAEADDAARISQIAQESYAIYLSRMDRKPFPMLADYEDLIAKERVFVLESANQISGFVVLLPAADGSLLLDNVAISPDCQNQGFGRALVDFSENEALKRGLCAVTLYTNTAMIENLAWYPRLGFQETDRKLENGYQRVYFRKTLSY